MRAHDFGGQWTEDKLERLRKYLNAYMTIFSRNPRAAWFTTTYVDAFAGTGYRGANTRGEAGTLPLFDEDLRMFHKGSAQIALDTEPPFDKYVFIEQNAVRIKELEDLLDRLRETGRTISVIQQDSNVFLQHWCASTQWNSNRAVVFLDPYGMEVEWATIEAIAGTRAVDLWILFPLGQAVNRLLTRGRPPAGAWANRLTSCFGTDEWQRAFYSESKQVPMFDGDSRLEKTAGFESIAEFFIARLGDVFAKVAGNPLPLLNSRNVPTYLLCFAAGNPKGAVTAVRIAQDILRR